MAKDSDTLIWLAAAGVAGYFVYKKYFQASETSTAPSTAAGPVSSAVAAPGAPGPVSSAVAPVLVMQTPAPDASSATATAAVPTAATAPAVVSSPVFAPAAYRWGGRMIPIFRQRWTPQP